jgi:hypothetical protein
LVNGMCMRPGTPLIMRSLAKSSEDFRRSSAVQGQSEEPYKLDFDGSHQGLFSHFVNLRRGEEVLQTKWENDWLWIRLIQHRCAVMVSYSTYKA